MAYDEGLAARVRAAVEGEQGLTERAMFGGLGFMANGNMGVAVSGQGGLMLRCDPDDADELTASGDATRMVMRGREMNGWLRVLDDVIADDAALDRWVEVGMGYARSLPRK